MLIAEIGNNHFGSLDKAKELIRVAKECGADAVKLQAFVPGDFEGSMPYEFYQQCSFDFNQYMELIGFGKYINIPVFYSIFNNSLLRLEHFTEYTKLAAWQTNQYEKAVLGEYDNKNTIISINQKCKDLPILDNAIILYATDYNTNDPILQRIGILQRFYGRGIGLSDHTVGIETCKEAIELYQVPVIEKHFTLRKSIEFNKQVFRDTVHAATPSELTELVKFFKEQKQSYQGGNSALLSMQ